MTPEMQLNWVGEVYKQYMADDTATYHEIEVRLKGGQDADQEEYHGQSYELWEAGPFWWARTPDEFEELAWTREEAVRLIEKHIDQACLVN